MCRVRGRTFVQINYVIGYIPYEGEWKIMEGAVMNITREDACICSCEKLLIVKEYRGGGTQKEIIGMFLKYVKLATKQLIV